MSGYELDVKSFEKRYKKVQAAWKVRDMRVGGDDTFSSLVYTGFRERGLRSIPQRGRYHYTSRRLGRGLYVQEVYVSAGASSRCSHTHLADGGRLIELAARFRIPNDNLCIPARQHYHLRRIEYQE